MPEIILIVVAIGMLAWVGYCEWWYEYRSHYGQRSWLRRR